MMHLLELAYDHLRPHQALAYFASDSWPVLLESARFHAQRGRYSYFSAAPLQTWTCDRAEFGTDPFCSLRGTINRSGLKNDPAGPPFQGGLIGLLSYELGHCWERLPAVPADHFTTPPLMVGLYDWTLCWDHLVGQLWLITTDDPTKSTCNPRLGKIWQRIKSLLAGEQPKPIITPAPQNVTDDLPLDQFGIAWSTTKQQETDYIGQVARVIDYIRAGDIYQANISRKLYYPFAASSLELYQQIRQQNPAPFAVFFQPGSDWTLISASPEQFLQVDNSLVTTRPIKGTRPRWQAGDLDLIQGEELLASEKDRAENTMIVDLLRNDLSRVCQIGTVKVPRWCELETFEKVHHLVSEVTGHLRADCDIWDLLAATFPGGSITGAPKIRSMEIISELEQTARGAYCGVMLAAGWEGYLQSNILIRTLIHRDRWVQCPVGGGIVADSIPDKEYAETVHKAAGLIAAPSYHADIV